MFWREIPLKFAEVFIILAGLVAIQNLFRLVGFRLRLVYLSIAQISYSVLIYTRRPLFGFSPHLRGFIPFALLFAFTMFLGKFLGAKAANVNFKPSTANMLTLGLLLPVSEELLFRGAILALFPNAFVNGLIFSAMHLFNVVSNFELFSYYNVIYRFVVGFIFADSTLKTGSLFSAAVCHIINNCLGILLPWFEHESKKRRHDAGSKKDEQ